MAIREYPILIPYKFFILFLILLFIFYLGGIKLLPDFFLIGIINLIGYLVTLSLKILGYPASYEDSFITVSGFMMYVNLECTALHFLAIFSAAVLAYPLHNIGYKITGLLTGSLLIILINIIRITVLGITGVNFPQFFDFIHTYLWQGAFLLVVFLLWYIWVKGPSVYKSLLRFCGISFVASATAIPVLGLVMEPYLKVLAFLTERFFGILPISNSFSIIAIKNNIIFNYSDNISSFPLSVDIYDSVIFFALIATTSNLKDFNLLIKKLFIGTGVLSIMHLLFAMVTGYFIIYDFRVELRQDIFWVMRGTSIITPLLLWVILKKGFEIKAPVIKGFLKKGDRNRGV